MSTTEPLSNELILSYNQFSGSPFGLIIYMSATEHKLRPVYRLFLVEL